jgi:hypothetical protein
MARIEELASRYRSHIGAPWQRNLAGDQKAIFVVYPKIDERKLRARLELFEMATTSTGHRWRPLDLTDTFARWMSRLDYPDRFFESPRRLAMLLDDDFLSFIADRVRDILSSDGVEEDTVVAVYGIGTLFGFTHISEVLAKVRSDIRGRLVVFFPGEFEDNIYRLLDARDGWNYMAVPITLHNGRDE